MTAFSFETPAASPSPSTPAAFRRLQEVHGQVPVIRLQHTGDSAAGSAGALWPQGTVTDELHEPQIHSHFADWAQPRDRTGR